MIELISNSTYFGVAITVATFILATIINKKWPNPFTTPLFLSTIVIIGILIGFKIPYETYNSTAKYLTYFLVPVTVCFAVPMYRQLPLLKRHIWSILFAMFIGVTASVVSVCIIVILLGIFSSYILELIIPEIFNYSDSSLTYIDKVFLYKYVLKGVLYLVLTVFTIFEFKSEKVFSNKENEKHLDF